MTSTATGLDWDGTLTAGMGGTALLPGVGAALEAAAQAGPVYIATNQGGIVWRTMTGTAKFPTTSEVATHLVAMLDRVQQHTPVAAVFVATSAGAAKFGTQTDWDAAATQAAQELPAAVAALGCAVPVRVSDHATWRKPGAGMLRAAVDQIGVPAALHTFIGDMDSDRAAAAAAGMVYVDADTWRQSFVRDRLK